MGQGGHFQVLLGGTGKLDDFDQDGMGSRAAAHGEVASSHFTGTESVSEFLKGLQPASGGGGIQTPCALNPKLIGAVCQGGRGLARALEGGVKNGCRKERKRYPT